MDKFPLIAVIIDTLETFIVTSIDFDNEHVRRTIAQNGDGGWYSFEDVFLMENHECRSGLENYLLNSDINYQNYDKIDGKRTVFNNRFNSEAIIEDKERKKYNESLSVLKKELDIKDQEKEKLDNCTIRINLEIDNITNKLDQL